MSKINFEEDVANIDQTGLESVAELLRKQLQMESEIEDTEAALKDLKDRSFPTLFICNIWAPVGTAIFFFDRTLENIFIIFIR